jgi:hypothetical protein
MQQRVDLLPADERSAAPGDGAGLSTMVDRAREALVRVGCERPLAEVDAWAARVKKVEGGVTAPADLRTLYRWSRDYLVRQRRLHRFPGAYLVKAFNLAIKGLHYDIVTTGIVRQSNAGRARVGGRALARGPRAVAVLPRTAVISARGIDA